MPEKDNSLESWKSCIVDQYLDATFPSHPSIVDNDDLQVNGLMISTVAIYQILFVAISAALFVTSYLNEVSVIYLSPYTDNENKYCTVSPVEITGKYWIDKEGNFEGNSNYDASNTLYRIDMKNMKMTLEDYQEMIEYFEVDIKNMAIKASQRDATYNYIAYSCYSMRYFPVSGGTVDFYLSGDASVIFNTDYESVNFMLASKNDVCTPSNISIIYEENTIIPSFPTHHSIPYIDGSPTAAPTSAMNTTFFQVPYFVSSLRADTYRFEACDPGEYTFGDCDCSGDSLIYLSFNDDYLWANSGCEGPNKCSKLTYTYTESTCTRFNLHINSNDDQNVKGNLTLFGPKITDVGFYYSRIMCIGDISNACELTCPDIKQDITYVSFASWGNSTLSLNNPYPDPQLCEDSTASDSLKTIADRDCLNRNSCAISLNPGQVTTGCINGKSYISVYCWEVRRRLEMEQDAILKESIDDIDQISKINHSTEMLVPSEGKAESILNHRLAEETLKHRRTEETLKHRRTDETREHRRIKDRILNRRNLAESYQSSKQILKQPCYNDIDDDYVLKIQGYDEYGSITSGEMFKDNGIKASASIDVRSLATVIAVNSGLVSTKLLVQTSSFSELFKKANFTKYDFSKDDMDNFNIIIERKMGFYLDPFYNDMDDILCSSVQNVDICALIIDGTVVVPVLSSEGIRDAISVNRNPYYRQYYETDDDVYSASKEKVCLFQLSRVRCDRFSDEKCELDYVKMFDNSGRGYNNFLLGLIYFNENDLKNKAIFGSYLDWQNVLLRFMDKDHDNYDDNFQSAAYDIMTTYEYTNMFTSLKTDDGSYDYAAHRNAMDSTFFGYLNSTDYPAYSSSTCPAKYSQYLKLKFNELCGDINCKMMVITYRNKQTTFDNLLGNYVGTGTTRFKPGDRSTYHDQLYNPVPFKKIKSTPPQRLVDNVLTCRNNPTNIFWNSVGVTHSNAQLILGIIFSFILSIIVKVWNGRKNTTKLYSTSRKNYLHKQTISAALTCLKDRLHQIEEKIGCTNDVSIKNTSELFNEIIAVSDLVDQVDDIEPHDLIKTIKSMNISVPISAHRALIQEQRESKKSMKAKRKSNFSVLPLSDVSINDNRMDY